VPVRLYLPQIIVMEYDIYHFVQKCTKMSLPEVFVTFHKECLNIEKVFNRNDCEKIKTYKEYIDDFLFVFNTSFTVIPKNTGHKGLLIMKPIVENLILKGDLSRNVLNIFE